MHMYIKLNMKIDEMCSIFEVNASDNLQHYGRDVCVYTIINLDFWSPWLKLVSLRMHKDGKIFVWQTCYLSV